MQRTNEQIAADDALTAAIERTARAYGVLEPGDVMGDFVVLAETQELDGEGDVRHSYINLLRNGSVASTRAVGLMDVASFDIKSGRTMPDE